MSHSIPVTASAVVLAVVMTVAVDIVSAQQQLKNADEPELMGRLATVEPRARRISVVADGNAERVELQVADDGEILQEDEDLSLADLVIQVGSRVKVRYRMENGVRIARTITVEPPPGG